MVQVKQNVRELINTPEWLRMKATHEQLAIDVLEKVATLEPPSTVPPQKRIRLLDACTKPLEYFYRQ
jgi:hypothetical protein